MPGVTVSGGGGRHHVYLASNLWSGLWITQQPICWEIQKTEKIVFVERFVSIFTVLRYPRFWRQLFAWAQGARRISERLTVVSPLPLFHLGHRFPWLFQVEFWIQRLWIRWAVRRTKGDRILWVDNPMLSCAAGAMGERLFIYHVADEFSEFSTSHPAVARRLEKRMLARADLVFAAAERLADEKRKENPATYAVLNAIDARLFSDDSGVRDPVVAGIPSPRVVFIGVVDHWVDTALIRHVAKSLPEASVLVVGPGSEKNADLQGVANLHAIGPIPRAQVPSILKSASVSLVPFKRNALTERILPLKIFEALAAGVMPVCTPFSPELGGLAKAGFLRIGNSYDEFTSVVREVIAGDTPSSRERLRMFGLDQTWEARWYQMKALINTALERPMREGTNSRRETLKTA